MIAVITTFKKSNKTQWGVGTTLVGQAGKETYCIFGMMNLINCLSSNKMQHKLDLSKSGRW
jgi:hypothetical protein